MPSEQVYKFNCDADPAGSAAGSDVVNRGGDADTTGAIAGMLAGALYGMEEIPETWLRALATDTAKQCVDQAKRLSKLNS